MGRSRKNDIIVGVFVLVALAVFFAMTFAIRGTTGPNPYRLYTHFENVAGLEIGSPVLVSGFRLGRIVEMQSIIDEETKRPTVLVIASVARTIPIYKNAEVRLMQQGFIGDKRLEIDPGTVEAGEIERRGAVLYSHPPSDFMENLNEASAIVDDLRVIMANIREITSDQERLATIDQSLRNIAMASEEISSTLQENRQSLQRSMANIETVTQNTIRLTERAETVMGDVEGTLAGLRTDVDEVRGGVDSVLTRADEVGSNANTVLLTAEEEMKALSLSVQEVSEQLQRLLERVNSGEGTIGRLLTDDGPFRQLEESLGAVRGTLMREERQIYDRSLPYRPADRPAEVRGHEATDPEAADWQYR